MEFKGLRYWSNSWVILSQEQPSLMAKRRGLGYRSTHFGLENKVFCWCLLVGFFPQGLRAFLMMNNFLMGETSICPFQGSLLSFFSWKDRVWVQCLALLVFRVTYWGCRRNKVLHMVNI